MAKKRGVAEAVIIEKIYPIIADAMKTRKSQLKACIGRFIHARHEQLYDYAPIDRIYFKQQDINDFFHSINVDEKEIKAIIKTIYWWDEDELAACKDPFSLSMLMVIRYFLLNPKEDDSKKTLFELSYMYLAFSGKFYASCHYKRFPSFTPKREVMDYVINYMLSKKFDLVRTGSVWGAINSLTKTWITTYEDVMKEPEDEQVSMVIHQLYGRIYAFLRNISEPYYKAYEEKLYVNAESDNYSDDGNYRIANNNSTIAATITENTMNYMTTTAVSITRCHAASSSGVDPNEIKAIFENILNKNSSIDELRDVINILITDFMRTHPDVRGSDIPTSVDFIAHSTAMKPNTKDKDILRMKDIILGWLNSSERYRSIKTQTTKNNYYKAILAYIALTINEANRGV